MNLDLGLLHPRSKWFEFPISNHSVPWKTWQRQIFSFIMEKELLASRCQAGQKQNSGELMFGLTLILFCDPSFLQFHVSFSDSPFFHGNHGNARSSSFRLEKELLASRCQAGQKQNSGEVMFGLTLILFCDPSFLQSQVSSDSPFFPWKPWQC